jgi:large subunit ribosomal protein L4
MASITSSLSLSAKAAVAGRKVTLGNKRVAAVPGRSACVQALAADVAKVSFDGAASGVAVLDLKTASPDVAKGLVHKYVVMVRQNARRGTASTLTKSEVRGGGRKPFKQKGTGNARAGSSRTPLKPGGGVIFGPKPKDWSIKMNKKERRLAMATAIQSASGAMIVVDDLAKVATPKTKAMGEALKAWGVAEGEKAYLITKDASANVTLATRNMARVVQTDITHLNVYDVLNADKVVVEESALQYINDFYGAEGGAWA